MTLNTVFPETKQVPTQDSWILSRVESRRQSTRSPTRLVLAYSIKHVIVYGLTNLSIYPFVYPLY